jgi:hypothetical protein
LSTPVETEMPVAAAATPEATRVLRRPVRRAERSATSRCFGTYFSRVGTRELSDIVDVGGRDNAPCSSTRRSPHPDGDHGSLQLERPKCPVLCAKSFLTRNSGHIGPGFSYGERRAGAGNSRRCRARAGGSRRLRGCCFPECARREARKCEVVGVDDAVRTPATPHLLACRALALDHPGGAPPPCATRERTGCAFRPPPTSPRSPASP